MKGTFARLFVGMCVIAASAILAASPMFAQGQGARSLEGSWNVVVTQRNCSTGAAIRSFPRLTTFMQGGTMQEYAAAGTAAAPTLRSPGHGIWAHSGEQFFKYAIEFLRLDANGGPNGLVREKSYVQVDMTGDFYTAYTSSEVFGPNGELLFRACGTDSGTRFEALPD